MTRTRLLTAAVLLASIGPAFGRRAGRRAAGAAACSGCHPAARVADTSMSRLIGRDPATIVTAMQGFKSGQLPGTVMGRIAKGFSDDEIKAIAAWYGAQKD